MNGSKTKITIFGEKVKDQSKYSFKYKDEELEIVNCFKYLGVTFNQNGSFKDCIEDLKKQATRSMYALIAKSRRHGLPVDIQLELFDMLVAPILLYGSEVWGFDKAAIECEKLHRKYIKFVLKLRNNTCNAMVYGESGRFPITIKIKLRMISFWAKMKISKEHKLTKCAYESMRSCNTNLKWTNYVKNILDSCGLYLCH